MDAKRQKVMEAAAEARFALNRLHVAVDLLQEMELTAKWDDDAIEAAIGDEEDRREGR